VPCLQGHDQEACLGILVHVLLAVALGELSPHDRGRGKWLQRADHREVRQSFRRHSTQDTHLHIDVHALDVRKIEFGMLFHVASLHANSMALNRSCHTTGYHNMRIDA
jgi:hypothetical protein